MSSAEQPPRARVLALIDAQAPTMAPLASRTGAALGVHVAEAITAIHPFTALPERLVRDQIGALLAAPPIDTVLVGDVGAAERAPAVAEALVDVDAPVILDPSLIDGAGQPRHARAMPQYVRERLCPLLDMLVLNAAEAALLIGREVHDHAMLREAGARLFDHGVPWIVLGGGRVGRHAVDLIYDGRDVTEVGGDRRAVPGLMGAGRVFSAAIASRRALGDGPVEAVFAARKVVDAAITRAVRIGTRRLARPVAGPRRTPPTLIPTLN